MRLIDADALMEQHPEIVSRYMKFNLDLAPTIDAKPVVHAFWADSEWANADYKHPTWRVCSNCMEQHGYGMSAFRYCPMCGAKMDLNERK